MGKYKCANSVEEIKTYIGNSRVVAFDFETAPNVAYRDEDKAALDPAKAHIVGCSFSVREGTGIYVPIKHLMGKNVDEEEFFAFLRDFLSDKNIIKVAHNLAFESAMAYTRLGVIIQAPVYDTICAAQLVNNGDVKFRSLKDSGLKQLASEQFGEDLPTFEETTKGAHFDELYANDAETVRYGSADSDFALRLYYRFNEWFDTYLPKHRNIVEKIESPAAVYIGIMRANGLPINRQLMEKRGVEAESEMARIRNEIKFLIGDVEIGASCSTKAFKDYLYRDLELPILKTTESGSTALDDETLMLLQEWCDVNRPELSKLFSLVQEYRKWSKIETTYIDGYLKHINTATGRIHPDILALSTETGRMCCRNPNAQNMPRKGGDPIGVRDFIQAPDGHLILSLDFSQIELRIGAFYCRDERMLDVYRDNGDIHAATTSVIFGVSYDEAVDKHVPQYKERRTIAKNVNFGTFYGLFPKGLQKTLKFKAGIDKSTEECAEIINSLKRGYKRLSLWQEETKAEAARRGYTETWLGRRRYLPDIWSEDWGRKSFAERCALNTPIQGTAADILKLAMAHILSGLPERQWLKPVLQIHDELVFVIPEDRLTEATDFIRKCMENKPFPEFDLPLIAEASYGKSFGAMEEILSEE
ncbi:bifunctional 3'-5' exonuclease/DNA polymerase [uncultured Cloacibacillus sp.]|uniref:bifunctional 3'-5' exonuclease/DNA polymerase n=1 Tax=uncultured Cloacibacillus sp. TaxID=889794 RepID=UPI0026DC3A09|nr:bifunctional 3'-5' exonuclease/DNA polymerase [uncultured Cloacibacillus sp.]